MYVHFLLSQPSVRPFPAQVILLWKGPPQISPSTPVSVPAKITWKVSNTFNHITLTLSCRPISHCEKLVMMADFKLLTPFIHKRRTGVAKILQGLSYKVCYIPCHQSFSHFDYLFWFLEYLPLYIGSLFLCYEGMWDSPIAYQGHKYEDAVV